MFSLNSRKKNMKFMWKNVKNIVFFSLRSAFTSPKREKYLIVIESGFSDAVRIRTYVCSLHILPAKTSVVIFN